MYYIEKKVWVALLARITVFDVRCTVFRDGNMNVYYALVLLSPYSSPIKNSVFAIVPRHRRHYNETLSNGIYKKTEIKYRTQRCSTLPFISSIHALLFHSIHLTYIIRTHQNGLNHIWPPRKCQVRTSTSSIITY